MNKLWKKISSLGLSDNLSVSKRKSITLSNQINFILLIMFAGLSLFLLYIRMSQNTEMTFASKRLLIIFAICLINIWLAYKKFITLLKISLIFIPAFIYFIVSSYAGFIEEESYFYYPFVAISLSVVMQLILTPAEDKILYWTSLLYYFIIAVFSYDILTYFSQEKYEAAILIGKFILFYKTTTIAIFVFIHASIYYLRNMNYKYEQELSETLKDLQDTQTTLVQSEKMASLGILTAGVAHEINNPLNFITGAYNALEVYFKKKNEETEEIKTLLDIIKTGIERTANIVKGLNQFSRDNAEFDEECNIHTIINNCLTMLNSSLKETVSISKEYSNEEFIMLGNTGKLHQIFLNIIGNASQAIEGKGSITISTFRKGKQVYISINDTGPGIKREHLSKVTDPFFTTKAPGEGTGLGLSISYNIISEHGGEIKIDSTEGKGTNVVIILPLN